MDERVLILKSLDVPECVQDFNLQLVSVISWHITEQGKVGLVDEFAMDIPEFELVRPSCCQWFTCGMCHGMGKFREYENTIKCGLCSGFGGNYSVNL